jgi:hypothetical protein
MASRYSRSQLHGPDPSAIVPQLPLNEPLVTLTPAPPTHHPGSRALPSARRCARRFTLAKLRRTFTIPPQSLSLETHVWPGAPVNADISRKEPERLERPPERRRGGRCLLLPGDALIRLVAKLRWTLRIPAQSVSPDLQVSPGALVYADTLANILETRELPPEHRRGSGHPPLPLTWRCAHPSAWRQPRRRNAITAYNCRPGSRATNETSPDRCTRPQRLPNRTSAQSPSNALAPW